MSAASGIGKGMRSCLVNAWQAWRLEPMTGTKYVFFTDLVQEQYGIKLYQQMGVAEYTGYDVVDEEKFTLFLLKFS